MRFGKYEGSPLAIVKFWWKWRNRQIRTIDDSIEASPWIDDVIFKNKEIAVVRQISQPDSPPLAILFQHRDGRQRSVGSGLDIAQFLAALRIVMSEQ